MKKRPYVLTIAGLDPSSGAGLIADIKTFEALKTYGLAVCSANTIQNDVDFVSCDWVTLEVIKKQIQILFDRFSIDVVKIGIVQDWSVLNRIIDFLLRQNNQIKIVLDPIVSASAGFDFHDSLSMDKNLFDEVLEKIYVLTPNYKEIQDLYRDKNIEETIQHISSKTNLYLKGGHRAQEIGKDELYTITNKYFALNPKMVAVSEKHGSGCVLSSAITAQLALGFSLLKACYKAKRYTEKVLSSNKTLLGYHRF